MLYRGDFWVFLNTVFWDQQKNMSSIESIVVRYRYYRIRLGIDAIELVSILLPSLKETLAKIVDVTFYTIFAVFRYLASVSHLYSQIRTKQCWAIHRYQHQYIDVFEISTTSMYFGENIDIFSIFFSNYFKFFRKNFVEISLLTPQIFLQNFLELPPKLHQSTKFFLQRFLNFGKLLYSCVTVFQNFPRIVPNFPYIFLSLFSKFSLIVLNMLYNQNYSNTK